jgi:hypothetical protein
MRIGAVEHYGAHKPGHGEQSSGDEEGVEEVSTAKTLETIKLWKL